MMAAHWTERREIIHSQRQGDHRSIFQRDKARILHSAAFRRLQAKTQVLGVGNGDFHRTRLTHSLEASQIGQGIAIRLATKHPDYAQLLDLDPTLIEGLCLAHDIGHPPFGHGGEIALNYMMRDHGGFEGNGQTFRIITKLEPYTPNHGMNLSRRSLLGLVKYPNFLNNANRTSKPKTVADPKQLKAQDWLPPKGLFSDDEDAFNWLIAPLCQQDKDTFIEMRPAISDDQHRKTQHKSFDCSIMELADDIAYAVHDLEDAIVMGIIHPHQFAQELVVPIKALQAEWISKEIDGLGSKLFDSEHYERKDAIGALVNHFISAIDIVDKAPEFKENLLRYNAVMPAQQEAALKVFKEFVYQGVIQKPEMQQLEYKGQQIIIDLFTAFSSDPQRLLPLNTRKRWLEAQQHNKEARVISDYIAGMTDGFAFRMHANLFLPQNQGLTFSGF
ncbi:anti-phage deoxyguanosine triphosphatase [Alteromonas sp. a30]|uniref:anti-phage deoxyguanosine triphosphatase n=1 Tax=Alteromonas sp. a30 TaxID=2730917 RepID=UPI00227F27F8|nr:anti-phage deoxyguanosine triphosphatase [Alteromonas sp. a30]